jgi:glycosyltransferase involved in cell wall biosynthesis
MIDSKIIDKKLLIVCQTFGYLLADIAKTFVESNRYIKVVVLTGDIEKAKSFALEGVDIDSMYPYVKDSMKSRFISWIKGFIDIEKKVRRQYKDYELFLISNPGTISFLHLFCRNKYYSLTWDLFPDGFLTSASLKKFKPLFRLWSLNNKYFYAKAEGVFCISEGMAKAMEKYVSKERITVVPLWANDRIPIINVPKVDNKFLQNNNLTNRFIIQYSGNMGQGHSLETLIDAANILRGNKDICFLFIGEGWLKPHLQEKVLEYGLEDSCFFLPYQPIEILPYSFSCSDIAVVSLHDVSVSMPSKTFDIIRMGKPVICIADPKSSLFSFVKKNGFGECFTKDQSKDIAAFIQKAYFDSSFLVKYKNKSKECAQQYSREKQTIKFLVK